MWGPSFCGHRSSPCLLPSQTSLCWPPSANQSFLLLFSCHIIQICDIQSTIVCIFGWHWPGKPRVIWNGFPSFCNSCMFYGCHYCIFCECKFMEAECVARCLEGPLPFSLNFSSHKCVSVWPLVLKQFRAHWKNLRMWCSEKNYHHCTPSLSSCMKYGFWAFAKYFLSQFARLWVLVFKVFVFGLWTLREKTVEGGSPKP